MEAWSGRRLEKALRSMCDLRDLLLERLRPFVIPGQRPGSYRTGCWGQTWVNTGGCFSPVGEEAAWLPTWGRSVKAGVLITLGGPLPLARATPCLLSGLGPGGSCRAAWFAGWGLWVATLMIALHEELMRCNEPGLVNHLSWHFGKGAFGETL